MIRREKKRKHKWSKGRSYASRNVILQNLGFGSYADYLSSPTWQAIREQVLTNNPACLACGLVASQIHHVEYSKKTLLGDNLLSLVALCRACHEDIEFDADGNKRSLARTNEALEQKIRANRKRTGRHTITIETTVRTVVTTVVQRDCQPPIRKGIFKNAPQCEVCKCWRITAAVDGVCSVCKKRASKNNCDTANEQQSALGLPSRATTTSNRTVCELGDTKTDTYRAG